MKKKSKMGRPRRTKQLATARIAFRVSDAEMKLIERAAGSAKTSLSANEFARAVTLAFAEHEVRRAAVGSA